jgi:hypothetical protein
MLRRFWFPLPSHFGIGVTAPSEVEARALATATLAEYFPTGMALGSVVADVDVRTLDAAHVLPNIGVSAQLGVWYPNLHS